MCRAEYCARWMQRVVAVVLGIFMLAVNTATAASAAAAVADCAPGVRPYDGLPGAVLVAEVHVSKDRRPVSYVRWRGTVPSFDGMPLSVDVTIPCGARGPQPTVVMAHGFTDDKTVWEETGKSDTVHSIDRPATNDRWNNIWFASRGYVVLNYTARVGVTRVALTLPATAPPRQRPNAHRTSIGSISTTSAGRCATCNG